MLLLTDVKERRDVELIPEKLVAALAAPWRLSGRVMRLTASIGISSCPDGRSLRFSRRGTPPGTANAWLCASNSISCVRSGYARNMNARLWLNLDRVPRRAAIARGEAAAGLPFAKQ